jgi:hypothetical protein
MRQLAELETILQHLVTEHEKLVHQLDEQQSAMKKLDLRALEEISKLQEATRLRIASLEARRRATVSQLSPALKIQGPATLSKVIEASAANQPKLPDLRARLKDLMDQIATRSHIASRLAVAVLGHLNTMVRLLATAVDQPGVYTKHGAPQVTARIGVLEAIG